MSSVVIAGGGFAGVFAAMGAARAIHESGRKQGRPDVILVSRDPYLTIRPRLYESTLDDVRVPLRQVLDPLDVRLVEADIEGIDARQRALHLSTGAGGSQLAWDRLVLATGSQLHRASVAGLGEHGFDVDTFAGAKRLAEHLARLGDRRGADGQWTVVVVGAGFTGIEVATEMAARLRALAPTTARPRVVLVERANVVGPELGDNPRPHILAALAELQVETRLGATVQRVEGDRVVLGSGEHIPTLTIVWTAGLRASPLAGQLGIETDALGRVPVDPNLRVVGLREIFAAGDVGRAEVSPGRIALMSCQHAIPQGKVAGFNAAADELKMPLLAYAQPDYKTCLDLGAGGALFTTGWDRQTVHTGSEAKALKRTINTQWIVPPSSGRAEDLIRASVP